MGKKHLKFVSISNAIEEIKTTFLMQSEFKKQEELEPILRQLEDLQIRKDTKKVHLLDFVSRYKTMETRATVRYPVVGRTF
jgi:hypothetical protein